MEPDRTIHLLALSIPIVAIVMGCGIPIVAIYLDYRKKKEIFQLHHQERLAAIEKGVEVPPLPDSFFTDDDESSQAPLPGRYLLKGLIWLFIGLGLFWWLSYLEDTPAALGTIPAGIGVAYLIYYFVEGKKEALHQMKHSIARRDPSEKATA